MQRDLNLFREILLEVEKLSPEQMWESRPLLGHDDKDVFFHVQLLKDAGLVVASFCSGYSAIIQRITNDGYDFLEASKVTSLWDRTKTQIAAAGLPLTIATAKTVLQALINDGLAKLLSH